MGFDHLWWVFLHFGSHFASLWSAPHRLGQIGHSLFAPRWTKICNLIIGKTSPSFSSFKEKNFKNKSSWNKIPIGPGGADLACRVKRDRVHYGLLLWIYAQEPFTQTVSVDTMCLWFILRASVVDLTVVWFLLTVLSTPKLPQSWDSHTIMHSSLEKICCKIEGSREAAWLALWISLNLHSFLI